MFMHVCCMLFLAVLNSFVYCELMLSNLGTETVQVTPLRRTLASSP